MMRFAVNLIVITAISLSVQSCNGQCMQTIVLDTINHNSFLFLQQHTVHLVTVSGCTIHMATPPLKGVCCRPAYQTSGGQCVNTGLTVMKEDLFADNLDTVEVRSVSTFYAN